MNVVGIIAEYNPFHRGHEYQIRTLKERCHADYVVAAMSGNFVQRGVPALMDKYSRAKTALGCGADLVIELPTLFSTASAEYFARGGVSLLNQTGVVTHLGFGVETNDNQLLSKIANTLLEEPKPYQESLRRELKTGSSFPAARSAALASFLPEIPEIGEILASPNNILALEYLQALTSMHSAITPVPVLRRGCGYHDEAISDDFCSASAIRSCIKNGSSPLPETAMPKTSYKILKSYPHPFLFEDDFSALLHYELLNNDEASLASWGDSSPELARRMMAEREYFTNWSSFCLHMKTKNFTYARLSRLCTHMLLHIRQKDYRKLTAPSYLRILGFRKSAAPLLSSLKRNSSLPLITSLADAGQLLSPEAKQLLAPDLRATELYRLVLTAKGDYTLKNDYRQQIIRL